jgi:uncharacterized protein
MASTFVSPGIYVREFDFSHYVASLGLSSLGMVGMAQRGPVNVPTLITNEAQFIDTFGEPWSEAISPNAAIEYLQRGTQLYFVRVGNPSLLAAATVTVKDKTTNLVNTLTINAKTPGSYGNNIVVRIFDATTSGFKITVEYKGLQVEQFDALQKTVSDPRFVETIVNAESAYIAVDYLPAATDEPKRGSYALVGGNSGVTGITDADFIGTATGGPDGGASGLQIFKDVDRSDINLLACSGVSSGNVGHEVINVAEYRADCLGIVDPPLGLDVQEIADWHNGVGYTHSAFTSDKAGLFWPWVQRYDSYQRRSIWAPPSGFAAQSFAYNDQVRQPWFAAAGLERGTLYTAQQVEMRINRGDYDFLYGPANGNAVNAIRDFGPDGIVIDGNRTLQRFSSALDRINVRRGFFFIEKSIAKAARVLKFDQNDRMLWDRFNSLVTPHISSVVAQRGIEDFRIICDKTTNTDDRRNNNEMVGKIYIVPVKSAEKIIIDFALFASGATFSEPTF